MKFLKCISIITIILFVISCGEEKQGNMTVKGTIKGLKKGTLYLQKVKDTTIVSVDSILLKNTNKFVLTAMVESPELFFISLGKNNPEKISFFGEKGEIIVNSKLDKFVLSAHISGSKNQTILEDYNKMVTKFNEKRLDLLEQKFNAYKSKNNDSVKKYEDLELRLLKRKYLYATNFAISKANYEVAPYIALSSIDDANITLLDTINESLSEKVKKSTYGKQLNELIQKLQKRK